MNDKIRLPADLGLAVREHRKAHRLSTVQIAQQSGRSRDVLHRLERGDDVTVGSLFDILRAMGLCLRLERAGMPTLQEMQSRFGQDDEDAA